MLRYNYIVKPLAAAKIRSFYRNGAKKYRHTYDYNDFMRDLHSAVFSIYKIENGLSRRTPTIVQ